MCVNPGCRSLGLNLAPRQPAKTRDAERSINGAKPTVSLSNGKLGLSCRKSRTIEEEGTLLIASCNWDPFGN